MHNHLVSICIPTYNGEKYLQESLDSIKLQTYQNIEVIISDDSSKDSTLLICEKFKKEVTFPVYIYKHTPSGIGANWNYSIENANGEYIKILFQDDVMETDCIEEMMRYLLENKLEIVVCKRKIIDADSKEVSTGIWYHNFNDLQKPAGIESKDFFVLSKRNLKNYDYERYSMDNIIGEPCVSLFTKKLVKRVGPFNANLKQILDYEYWLRILIKYDIGIIGRKLMKFRYHDEQTSNINTSQNIDERHIILSLLHGKLLFYIDRKMAKKYLKQKYPIIQRLAILRYKIFP